MQAGLAAMAKLFLHPDQSRGLPATAASPPTRMNLMPAAVSLSRSALRSGVVEFFLLAGISQLQNSPYGIIICPQSFLRRHLKEHGNQSLINT